MSNNQNSYVDSGYLHTAARLFAPVKQRSYELMALSGNRRILDIGCGAGIDTEALSALVGDRGTVFGVDMDSDMLATANASNTATSFSQYIQSTAAALPFPDDSFDAVRSERLLMHLADPEQMLSEAQRVLRVGGRLVVIDTDWGSLSANTGADDIDHRLARFRADVYLPNGYSGRRLKALFEGLSLQDIALESRSINTTDVDLWRLLTKADDVAHVAESQGVINGEELAYWRNALEAARRQNSFFGSVSIVTASATLGARAPG